jgi:hypothetical protein
MRRYQGFDHLEPNLSANDQPMRPAIAALVLAPIEDCGFELFFPAGIVIFSGTWTIPNLKYNPAPGGFPNHFLTFFSLGFLDVHIEMTVDAAQNITTLVRIHTGAQVALPVRPGDAISATLCLQTNTAGTAFYGLVNETTGQTVNLTIDTGFPKAVTIAAGISRFSQFNGPPDPLARFGVVYFDELQAFPTNGTARLTDGVPTSMVDRNGSTLAVPVRLTDFSFRVDHRGS